MSNMSYAVGVDIGGTHIEGVCINPDMRIIKEKRIRMPARLNKKLVISKVLQCLDLLCGDEGKDLLGIGVGVPGVIKGGVVKKSPNLPFLDSTDFRSLISGKFKTKVAIDNEVNCMAFGESVSRKEKNVVVLTLGTGIGGGLVINGKVHRGRSFAGEIGHMTIKFDGSKCVCGNTGCFEEYASARSVRRLSTKLLGKGMEPHEVYELAEKGNEQAKLVWKEYGKMLGVGLANLCFILDPAIIVLGGGISKACKYFEDPMLAEMKKRMFIPLPKIVVGKSNANAYGAACMALKNKSSRDDNL